MPREHQSGGERGLEDRTGRLRGLDVLRGCAAGAVMLHHHGQYYDVLYPGRTPLSFDLGAGHFGVELFFIISGFVILMTIERKKAVWEFGVSRVARLMPAFVAALFLATVILTIRPMPPLLDTPSPRQFLANLTMAPSLLGELDVDLPYWTLTYELVFYVSMALALRFRLLRSIEWLGLIGVALGYLFWAVADVQLHHRSSILLLVQYSNFFLIGICLYRLQARRAQPITYIALAVSILVTGLGGGERAFYAPGSVYLPLTLAFTALVWLAARHGVWLASAPMVFLGRISYPLYLVHVVLGFQVIRIGIEQGWSTLTGVIAAGAVCIGVAAVMHYVVEVPGQRWAHSLLKRAGEPALARPPT
jgi:peptidoglycan/LPS O-acetylase OafA/YrhL